LSVAKPLRFAAALALGLALSSCDIVFGLEGREGAPNRLFAGCFRGPVTEPPNTPPITVVFVPGPENPGTQLTGCGLIEGVPDSASTLVGTVREMSQAEADITFTQVGGAMVRVVASHDSANGAQPEHVALVSNIDGQMFSAPSLARCRPRALTCTELEIVTP
jgi:hypothetical protein